MHFSLQPYVERAEKGLLRMVRQDGLVLFNYTDQCTFERAWDEYTLKARGIIFEEDTGLCVARPFDKFFNYEEYDGVHGPGAVNRLVGRAHYIQQKLDGSLGILYYYQGSWRVATRGSFTSDQALRATKMLKKYEFPEWYQKLTILVEIIYPENKIIVPYGDKEELVLLALRDAETGVYLHNLKLHSQQLMMPLAVEHEITIVDALMMKKRIPYTDEGFVVVFPHFGDRLKIKGDDYMRIAKFKANLSPLAVWEALSLDKIHEFEVACPEECRDELEIFKAAIQMNFFYLKYLVEQETKKITWDQPRKEVAMIIQNLPKWMHGPLFGYLSRGTILTKPLWEMLRPTGNQLVDIRKVVG